MPFALLTSKELTTAPAVLDQVLALNNDHVPAVNRLDAATLRSLVDEACYFVVAIDDAEAPSSTVAAFMICMGPGAKYESPNYTYFARMYAENNDFVYVDRIVVAPAFQRRGLGRDLYNSVDAFAATAAQERPGFQPRHVCAEVNIHPPNDESLAFHARCGFGRVGEQSLGVVDGHEKRVAMLARVLA